MNLSKLSSTFGLFKNNLMSISILTRSYSKPMVAASAKKKKIGKLGPIMEKKEIPVETDVNKLVHFVCGSNYMKTGQDIKLKADSEYPEWLWKLNVDRIIPLEELDPETKQYWRRLRKIALRRNNKLSKLKKF